MSAKSRPKIITADNISVAWAQAFLAAVSPQRELVPLFVNVTLSEEQTSWEDPIIRRFLDATLRQLPKQSCNTVANTIFPESLWNSQNDRSDLYKRYFKIWPRIRRCRKNKYGVYFHRLIDYALKIDGDRAPDRCNQLDQIIQMYTVRKGVRRTVLQASVFDPSRDHARRPYLHFPCLQHVTFTPFDSDRSMAVNGFYAMQYLLERAYGNYLGLCRLGRFMAHELGLNLRRLTCSVGIGQLEISNDAVNNLAQNLRQRLGELGLERK